MELGIERLNQPPRMRKDGLNWTGKRRREREKKKKRGATWRNW